MIYPKDDAVLRELEGLSEEECLDWFMRNYDVSRNEAARLLSVARGESSPSELTALHHALADAS